jgi:hypothetical protein
VIGGMTNDKKKGRGENAILQLIAGASSGAITKTSIAPLDRIKILLQIQGSFANFFLKTFSSESRRSKKIHVHFPNWTKDCSRRRFLQTL